MNSTNWTLLTVDHKCGSQVFGADRIRNSDSDGILARIIEGSEENREVGVCSSTPVIVQSAYLDDENNSYTPIIRPSQ